MSKGTTKTKKADVSNKQLEKYLLTVKNITQAGNLSIRFNTDDDNEIRQPDQTD